MEFFHVKALPRWVYFFSLTCLAFVLGFHLIGTTDLFWQIKTAEMMVETQSFITQDPFTLSVLGVDWVHHEWLSGIIFFFAQSLGGFFALGLLSSLLIFLIAVIMFLALENISGETFHAWVLSMFFLFLSSARLQQLRPELFGFLCFVFLLVWFVACSKKHFYLPLIIQLFWANTHASSLLGPFLAGLFFLFEKEQRKKYFFLFLGLMLVSMINPFGADIFFFPFKHLSQDYDLSVSSDWTPLGFWNSGFFIASWAFLVSVLALFFFIFKQKKYHFALLLLSLAMSFLSFKAQRFLPFAFIALFFTLAKYIADQKNSVHNATKGVVFVFLSFCIFLSALFGPLQGMPFPQKRINVVFGRPLDFGIDYENFPVNEINFLKQLPGNEMRIFNDMAYGGFIVYELFPRARVFFDSRTPLYREDLYRSYVRALQSQKEFDALIKAYNLNVVLYDRRQMMHPKGPLKWLLKDKRWSLASFSENGAVFLRKDVWSQGR